MNYAKVIGAALELFPIKITVSVIDEISGAHIGKYKIALSQLPSNFNKPTILEVEGHTWRVVKATPVVADDFSISKKLTLHILEKSDWSDERLQFNVPTRHACPPLIIPEPLFNDFILDLKDDQWRQLEWLPAGAIALVQKDISHIERIQQPGNLWGYSNIYVREHTANVRLDISLVDFCHLVQVQRKGAVSISGNGFVQNGIAIETANHTYYGTIIDNTIVSLCLLSFECVDDEFMQVAMSYDLMLTDWCDTQMFMVDLADAPEQDMLSGTPDVGTI